MQKQNEEKIPDVEKDGWKAEELVEEAANEESSDIVEKLEKADESKEENK